MEPDLNKMKLSTNEEDDIKDIINNYRNEIWSQTSVTPIQTQFLSDSDSDVSSVSSYGNFDEIEFDQKQEKKEEETEDFFNILDEDDDSLPELDL